MSHTRQLLLSSLLVSLPTLHAQEAVVPTAPEPQAAPTDLPDVSLLPVNPDPAPIAPVPSTNVTINLISRLVQKGILTQGEATELIKQAEADAATAQQAAAVEAVTVAPVAEADSYRIPYIPEVVRDEMRDEIKQELLAQAAEEKWGKSQAPEWTSKFRPFGDIRGRYEGVYFPEGNDNTGAFPNFNAINTGAPFDISGTNFSPQYNVDQDRKRARLRARFGTEIMLGEGFNAGLRLATGGTNAPTSPNQTLGGAGGNFSKYAIWLDRAFLSYDAGPGDGEELLFLAGRFDNPFFSSEVQWDEDLGFDGLAVRGKFKTTDRINTFFTAGHFPVYNTDFNFSSNQPEKFESTDKWLTGAQLGIEWKINKDLTAKVAASYYDFNAIEGKLSTPFTPLSPNDAGDTDTRRPAFAQRGNTYMALRDILPTAANDFGTKYQYQYYGLASEFRNITLTGRLDYDAYDPFRLSLIAEATKNVGFDENGVASRAVNNRGAAAGAGVGAFEGGDTAWNMAVHFGKPALATLGDWQVVLGYRYVESDAVVDGFTDSDFGGGGTNLKGFSLGGNMALSDSVKFGVRWMSADEIAGPPLATDTLQFDLSTKF